MEMMATSVVPPPMSTIIEPVGSLMGSPAPMAAAIGSSTRYTRRAPARSARVQHGPLLHGRDARWAPR